MHVSKKVALGALVLVLSSYALPYDYFRMGDGHVVETYGAEVIDAHVMAILVMLASMPALAPRQGRSAGRLGRIVMAIFGSLAVALGSLALFSHILSTVRSPGPGIYLQALASVTVLIAAALARRSTAKA